MCSPGTGTAFWCHLTLLCLGVSTSAVWLAAEGWQSDTVDVQHRVLEETTAPPLDIVQLSPTEGECQFICLLIEQSVGRTVCVQVGQSVCLREGQLVFESGSLSLSLSVYLLV